MKKRILILIITAALAACNNSPKTNADIPKVVVADTVVSSSQSALNDKAPVMQMNGVNDTIISKNGDEYVKVQPNATNPAPATPQVKAVHHHVAKSAHTSSAGTVTTGTSQPVSGTETASAPAEVKKKKKISNAVKGTVIGAGSGAVLGAIVSKKKGTGAVVGGLLGAGAGYIIGHKKDKKQQQPQSPNQ